MTSQPPPFPRPPPPPRQGPRPLGLHLATATQMLLSSCGGLQLLKNGWPPWMPQTPDLRERGREIASLLASADAERDSGALARAVDLEVRRRLDRMLTGIERYRRHPYRRDLPDPPAVWRESGSRLLDYGPPGGAPVLFVPSLVNRAYVLDLSADRSLMRWLSAQGVRPLLLDWGTPGDLERRMNLTDYIAGRLERALGACVAVCGRPPAVAGYCMGGLLAAALALRKPEQVASLALLATPWNFHAEEADTARRAAQLFQPFGRFLDAWGELPVDAVQALFAQLDPLLALKKFAQFARMDPNSRAALAFVALEDWLNDGVALPAAVARDTIAGWYGRNDTHNRNWLIAGLPVRPEMIAVPTLALIPEKDRIVPPASAAALADAVPGARVLRPHLGHIGMVVAGGAQTQVWLPLAEWIFQTTNAG
jgi:polyhydroxyalkanoate synthase subunit PhaC